jgi:hypothetical protein
MARMSGTMILLTRSAWAASSGIVFVAGAPADGDPDGVPPEGVPPEGVPEDGPEVVPVAQPATRATPQSMETTDVVILGVQRGIVVILSFPLSSSAGGWLLVQPGG